MLHHITTPITLLCAFPHNTLCVFVYPSTVQISRLDNTFRTVRYGAVRYSTVRYGTVLYGTVRYGTVRTLDNDVPSLKK